MNETNEWEMPPKTKSSAANFRARARAALKNHWGIAILAMLLAGLLGAFSLAGSGIGDFDLEDLRSTDKVESTLREWIDWGKNFDSTGALFRGILNRALAWVNASRTNLFAVIIAAFATLSGYLYALLLGSPVLVGYRRFGLQLVDGGEARIKSLFGNFNSTYWKTVGTNFLVGLCQILCALVSIVGVWIGIWFYLLYYYGEISSEFLTYLGMFGGAALAAAGVIYGVLLSFRFALCSFLLAEYPQFTPAQVLGHSKTLMKGNKWRLFCLYFSFIGWYLLGAVTCGIVYFWVFPYVHTAEAEFYDEISDRSRTGNMVFPSLDPNDYQ